MNDSIVSMKKVCFSYEAESPVLCDVDLDIPRGKSGYIVGPNGGGKSTLLKLMLGLLSPDKGEIGIFGTSPEKARLKIGYVPQYHQLDPSFPATAVEVVGTGLVGLGMSRSRRRQAIEAAMAELDISELRDRSFAGLSGGQRQRVLISRALVGAPELLLLDEPTASIDPGAEEKFYATIAELTKRMTVLTVSHDLGFVIRESALVICVNRTVSVHHSAEFTAETANRIYRHEVNLIEHSHSCFCNCPGTHRHEPV